MNSDYFTINEGSTIRYIEIGVISFMGLMIEKHSLFYEWNLNSLYILRDGTYKDMKYILTQVGIDLRKGASQKSQVLSPLVLDYLLI